MVSVSWLHQYVTSPGSVSDGSDRYCVLARRLIRPINALASSAVSAGRIALAFGLIAFAFFAASVLDATQKATAERLELQERMLAYDILHPVDPDNGSTSSCVGASESQVTRATSRFASAGKAPTTCRKSENAEK